MTCRRRWKEIVLETSNKERNDTPAPPKTDAARSDPPAGRNGCRVVADRAPDPISASSSTDGPVRNAGSRDRERRCDDTGHLYAEGMAAFNRADFDDAFHAWRLMLNDKPDHFVLQVEMDTYLVSAQSTVARYGDHSLYVVKKDDLYWVFSGLFATRAKAIEALRLLSRTSATRRSVSNRRASDHFAGGEPLRSGVVGGELW